MQQPPHHSAGSGDASDSGDVEIFEIPVERLALDPNRVSKRHSRESIEELARSIRVHGVLRPLIVRPVEGAGNHRTHWIVAGERRFQAAVLLGYTAVPCCIQRHDERAESVRALVIRIQQRDLSDIDKAETLKQLKSLAGTSWEGVAEMVGLSPTYVRRLAGLLKLERSVRDLVRRGEIPARTAIALKPLPSAIQVELAELVVRDRLTAEEVRKRAREALSSSTRATSGGAGAGSESTLSDTVSAPLPDALADLELVQIIQLLEQIRRWVINRNEALTSLSAEDRRQVGRYFSVVERLRQATEVLFRSLQDAGDAEVEEWEEQDLPTGRSR